MVILSRRFLYLLFFIWIATKRACWFLWYWCRAWWLTTLLSLDSGDTDGVVVLLVREGGVRKRGERNTKGKRKKEREENISRARVTFNSLPRISPGNSTPRPPSMRGGTCPLLPLKMQGESLKSIYLGHNYHLSREPTRRLNRIKSVSSKTMIIIFRKRDSKRGVLQKCRSPSFFFFFCAEPIRRFIQPVAKCYVLDIKSFKNNTCFKDTVWRNC